MTRKALGRGLSALLRETETAPPSSPGIQTVPVDQIDPNPFQPRRAFPEASLKELADSVRASGLVQPVLVRKADARYQLVVGERRWRAAKLAGLESIPAVVRELGDREALELALTENLLREDLNPMEVAQGLQLLQDQHGLTHEEIAAHLGLERSTVSNTLRLLRLPGVIQLMVTEGELNGGHARALLALKTSEDQIRAAELIAKNSLSVRSAEELIAAWYELPTKRQKKAAEPADPNVRAAELELERTLGTRVKIHGDARRGSIEIRYFSAEDLNRLYEWIARRDH
jgi:ParB family chromosome partitioning protein